ENQDFLTENVIITRSNNQGLFNIAMVSEFDRYGNASPVDTEWARGNTADFGSLYFSNWQNAIQYCPPCQVDNDFVLHLITDDIYIDIKILSWSSNSSGGGFIYER